MSVLIVSNGEIEPELSVEDAKMHTSTKMDLALLLQRLSTVPDKSEKDAIVANVDLHQKEENVLVLIVCNLPTKICLPVKNVVLSMKLKLELVEEFQELEVVLSKMEENA